MSLHHANLPSCVALAALLGCAGSTEAPLLASTLAISGQPSASTSGLALAPAVIVRVVTSDGRLVRSGTHAVTVRSLTGSALLLGTLERSTVDGSATFSDLRLDGTGQIRLEFSSTSLASAVSGVVTVSQVAASLVILRHPGGALSGRPFATQPIVTVKDNAGLTILTSTIPVTVTRTAGDDALTGVTTMNAVGGVAQFTDLALTGEGPNTLAFASSGLPSVSAEPLDVTLPQPLNLQAISAGGVHTCGLTTTGAAFCWGANGVGQVGDGASSLSRLIPRRVASALSFRAIAAGGQHSCALAADGVVHCWGLGDFGQLGRTLFSSLVPIPLQTATRFTRLAAQSNQVCAVATDSIMHCWGYNLQGALGDGTKNARVGSAPVSGTFKFTGVGGAGHWGGGACGITSTGDMACWGGTDVIDANTAVEVLVPTIMRGGGGYSALASSYYQTCGLVPSNGWRCFGTNNSGQRGDGTVVNVPLDPTYVTGGSLFISVTAGYGHACGLTAAGAAYCWGGNGYGQLGDGSLEQRLVPTPVLGGLSFSQISAGEWHTCAVATSGRPYCWGRSLEGRLGDGNLVDRLTPTAVAIP